MDRPIKAVPAGAAPAADPLALVRVRAKTAAEVAPRAGLGEAALSLLREGLTPRQFLDLLLDHEHYGDAIKFLAFALPWREAVWWGCLGLRLALGEHLPAKDEKAVRAAALWV